MASAAELMALAGMPSSPSRADQLAALAPFAGSAAHEAGAGALAPILAGLARGAWATLDYPRQVLQGEAQVMDPATGHVSDEAVHWGADRALNRMLPQKVAVAPGEQVLGASPIRAYHGSPHDFDRFDINRIGTGEGAQAYGHGLYFAENEGVARAYRDALAPRSPIQNGVATAIAGFGSREAALDAASARLARMEARGGDPANLQWTRDLVSELSKSQPLPGRMYEVGIHADPERFLDWDKPLSAQPQLRDTMQAVTEAGGLKARKLTDEAPGQALWEAMRSPFAAKHLGYGNWSTSGPSEHLREAGIPGIKYLDAGSRGAGTGSRNYVTFSDDIVEILRKYGLAGLGIGVPAALTMQPPPAQQQ